LGKECSSLACFTKDLFVNAMKCRRLTRFWLEWGRIGDVSDFAYSKHKGVSDFCSKWGDFRPRGVYWFVLDIGGMLGIVGWPNANTNSFLVTRRDLKFRIGDKGIKCVIPPDEEPGVIDEFEG
jgi:hypothetical protein